MNFTVGITDKELEEFMANNKSIKIIRNIVKMTDPKDDGLRMPYPHESKVGKKKKKKKKKK